MGEYVRRPLRGGPGRGESRATRHLGALRHRTGPADGPGQRDRHRRWVPAEDRSSTQGATTLAATSTSFAFRSRHLARPRFQWWRQLPAQLPKLLSAQRSYQGQSVWHLPCARGPVLWPHQPGRVLRQRVGCPSGRVQEVPAVRAYPQLQQA